MATKIQVRRDAAADWTSTNPTLAAGEIGFESDTNKFKIGDGATAWTSLAYAPQDYITASSTTTFTNKTFDANGTGNSISNIETADFATAAFKDEDTMTSDSATAVASQQSIKAYVDAEDANIASDTLTFTNKTFDANGTGNSISNIETADIAASTLVTAAEGIGSNNNDTTIPTSAAVKAYADSVGGGGGGTITALNNQAENRLVSIGATTTELDGEANLTFDGSTLTLTGSAALDGVTIADNLISTNRSNDNLEISANGTGHVFVGDGAISSVSTGNSNGRADRGVTNLHNASIDPSTQTTSASRYYANTDLFRATLTGNSTDSNARWQKHNVMELELNGTSNTATSTIHAPGSRFMQETRVDNNSATAATLGTLNTGQFSATMIASAGDVTITDVVTNNGILDSGGSFDKNVTNAYIYKAIESMDANSNITNLYGLYLQDTSATSANITNEWGVYAPNDAQKSRLGGVDLQNGDITTAAISIQDNHITTNRSNDNLNLETNGTGTIELNADTNVTGSITATTSISNDAISIDDNVITTTRSNDNLLMTANGTGYIVMGDTAANQAINVDVNERYGVIKVHRETVSASGMTSFNDHRRANTTKSLYTLSSGSSSGDAIFQQNLAYTLLDLNGYSLTGSYTPDFGSGASNKISTTLTNNGGTASSIAESHGMFNQVDHFSFGGSTLTSTNTVGNGVYINAYPNTTVTNAYGVRVYGNTLDFGSGPGVITNFYGFYIHDTGNNPTNQYGFWDTTNSLSRFGAVRLDNQAGDPSGVADASHIYSKDVSSSSEVFVRDEAGNVTQISPHNEQGEWQYYSVNEKTGKTVRVNMEQMIRKLEEITGETFIENE